MKQIRFFIALAFAALAGLTSCGGPSDVKQTKNLIIMVPDGTSTSVLACSRWYKLAKGGEAELAVDEGLCGLVRSYMSDAPISGSAGAMSAYMTGLCQQSPNISIFPKANPENDFYPVDTTRTFQPHATVMEAARTQLGKATGLVVTCYFTHATPAACTSHSYSRNDDQAIGAQTASFGHDVLFGGGTKHVTPYIKSILDDNGTEYIEDDVEAFRSYNGDGKVWALFDRNDMDYEADRDPETQPSLAEMTAKAIGILSKKKNGFVLMVEGSNVDHAAHANDPVGTIGDFLAFDEAVKVAFDFAKKDGNTTVVIMPDHGNSGITIGSENYGGYSSRGLKDAYSGVVDFKCTVSALSDKLRAIKSPDEIPSVFKEWANVDITPEEEAQVRSHFDKQVTDYMNIGGSLNHVVSRILSSRTYFGFVSGNHTIEDVFLSIYSPSGKRLEGVHTNEELGRYLCQVIGLKSDLVAESDRQFSPAEKVFDGCEMSVDSSDPVNPVLTVKNGDKTMVLPAYKAYVTLNDERVDLEISTVYMKKNKSFYVASRLGEMMK